MSSSFESYASRRGAASAAQDRYQAAASNLPRWNVAFNGRDRHGNYQRGDMQFRAIDADEAARLARGCKIGYREFNVIVTLISEEVTT